MRSILNIEEASGKTWDVVLEPNKDFTIGRARGNEIILNDGRVSRRHATILSDGSTYKILDGFEEDGEIIRSANQVFVNGKKTLEAILKVGDEIKIGATKLVLVLKPDDTPPRSRWEIPETPSQESAAKTTADDGKQNVKYDDKPLGNTQVVISAHEIIEQQAHSKYGLPKDDKRLRISEVEIKDLRRKAQILEMLYEMSSALVKVFDLKKIFEKATDLIFEVTPADRVVALLVDESQTFGDTQDGELTPIAAKTRINSKDAHATNLSISRTITRKVMLEKVALLSQDAKEDAQFSGSDSIVTQGVRSTICAPLITETNVHGVVYADRLDPFSAFTQDDLELISAVAAQTAIAVEMIRSHDRLAREEVARANYSRFMPEYVVQALLENPDSFELGGINQTITVLFADIRGFTAFSETQNPERVVDLLNRFFSAMSEIIFENNGILDKYLGDGLMAIFGAPNAGRHDADNAVKAAIEMQRRIIELNSELKSAGYQEIEIGIGLNTGIATIGYIGSDRRSEYTAIGDTVNLASRLESNSVGGQILVSDSTQRACGEKHRFLMLSPLNVRNRIEPVSVFEVDWK